MEAIGERDPDVELDDTDVEDIDDERLGSTGNWSSDPDPAAESGNGYSKRGESTAKGVPMMSEGECSFKSARPAYGIASGIGLSLIPCEKSE